ncbi:MAG: phosphoenolpyruvate carboxykinase domain-containing protein, partial [Arenimonas sp.]
RKNDAGKFMWPGFGDNLRVLEWMLKRVTGQAEAIETPIGLLPHAADLNTEGLAIDAATIEQLLHVDREEWQREMGAIAEYLESFGSRTPVALVAEQERIAAALG